MEIRPVKYRNNIVEPDHRFIKKVIQPGLGFQSIQTAAKTISGIEARHILWKGQLGRSFSVGLLPAQIVNKLFGLTA
jgi:transposase-like protein|tara:strand:+ start:514 stop:744 length:231 start_codon:yes stop_codon:yes gene_type:complete